MFHVPEYYGDISLKLSSVLEDVGVSKRLVLKRRRTYLLMENMDIITRRMTGISNSLNFFGSQSEGTTTIRLSSDTDILICSNYVNVIEDWVDWKAGALNFKMIQDENVSPGYCMLQVLRPEVPQPVTVVVDEHFVKLRDDMVVPKNSLLDRLCEFDQVKNGPSFSYSARGGVNDTDIVYAFRCRRMPPVVENWLQKQMSNGKLSPNMRRYIERNPCFLVPVGNTGSSHECVEWRISTSHAERCIMFNFNITQIHCYVMMKMMLKSILKHPHKKGLSSFMCKNVLILCIEKTLSELWCPANLLTMVTFCLFELQKCIIHNRCPHFIERRNNLLGRKCLPSVRNWLFTKVQGIIYSNGRALLEITTDDLGRRLQTKLNDCFNSMVHNNATPDKISQNISGQLMGVLAVSVSESYSTILRGLSLGRTNWASIFQMLARISCQEGNIAQVACRLLRPYLFSNFGCLLASSSLQQHNAVSPEALVWLRAGVNSDVASGRLKLASVLYGVQDIDSVYIILRSIEESYDTGLVAAVCECNDKPGFYISGRFRVYADSHNELSVKDITAYCVRFLPSEINCIPRELQYELFRSSQDDLLHRDKFHDCWMDWAVVDSLPFLYFLQYKTYGHLRLPGDQQRALRNLITIINNPYQNLGHRETAWNLAGQCMEQEDRHVDAFQCYVNSLNIRPRNNAANYFMCRLLYRVMCSRNLQ